MPSLTEIFNPTFIIFLGILLLVVALLVVYFESKMREQNHKIASMLSLVSSLAEELNGVKFGLNHLSMTGGTIYTDFSQTKHLGQTDSKNVVNSLIAVSDDDDDDESIDEDEDEDENSIDDDSVDDSDEESVSMEGINIIESNNVKVFKLNISETQDLNNIEEEEYLHDIEEFNEQETDVQSLSSIHTKLHVNKTDTNEVVDLHFVTEDSQEEPAEISQNEFKTININLEEHSEFLDYKKLPLNKLRNIASEKGIQVDSSKLKKNEILKLLGVE